MSEESRNPDASQPASEPIRDSTLQHLDAPGFPTEAEAPGAAQAELRKLSVWVNGWLVPRFVYDPSSERPWCQSWYEHEDAVAVLHAAYRAYLELMDTEVAGMTGPSTWIHQHLLPALNYLRSPTGPFGQCIRSHSHIGHTLPAPVPEP